MLPPELEQTYDILKSLGPSLARTVARYLDTSPRKAGIKLQKLRELGFVQGAILSRSNVTTWEAISSTRVSKEYYVGIADAARRLYRHFTDVEPDPLLADINQKDAERWRKIAERLTPAKGTSGGSNGNGSSTKQNKSTPASIGTHVTERQPTG